MCYDAKSSLTGFLVGGSASLYLLLFSKNNTYRHVSLFFLVVVFIQLAEYFMWIDQNCKKNYNNIASRSVILILCLQLFSLVFGGYIFNTTILPNYVMKYASIIFGGFTIYYFYYLFFNNNYNWCTKPNEDKSLQWANFYKIVRTKMNFLMKKTGSPKDYKWSFDEDNRNKLPSSIKIPIISKIKETKETLILKKFIISNFNSNPGNIDQFWFTTTRKDANKWLDEF